MWRLRRTGDLAEVDLGKFYCILQLESFDCRLFIINFHAKIKTRKLLICRFDIRHFLFQAQLNVIQTVLP